MPNILHTEAVRHPIGKVQGRAHETAFPRSRPKLEASAVEILETEGMLVVGCGDGKLRVAGLPSGRRLLCASVGGHERGINFIKMARMTRGYIKKKLGIVDLWNVWYDKMDRQNG